MKKYYFAAMSSLSLAGIIAAQTITGQKAENVKKEIMKIEDEKVAGLLRGGSEPVDWIKQYEVEDIAQTNIDRRTTTKGEVVFSSVSPCPLC